MVDIAVPTKLFTGDTLSFRESLSDYPASTWTATLYLQNHEGSEEFAAVADGDDHVFSRTGDNTKAWQPGRYKWFCRVSDGTTTTTIDYGWIVVEQGASGEAVDQRSFARKMFEAIEAMLEGSAEKDQLDLLSYNFGSISVQRDRRFLVEMRDKFARELSNENGTSARNRRHAKARFVRP